MECERFRDDTRSMSEHATDTSGSEDTPDLTSTEDRRKGVADKPAKVDRRGAKATSEYDRRRGPGRRRTDYRRDAEEGHMNEEQLEFIKAMDEYKRANNRPFPTWTEVLDLLLYLGYRKVAPHGEFKLTKARESYD